MSEEADNERVIEELLRLISEASDNSVRLNGCLWVLKRSGIVRGDEQ